jgi:predicted N-acetyltransferase YhbS
MSPVIRQGTPSDASQCGRICYDAFKALADAHAFPPDFPSPDVSTELLSMLLRHPSFYAAVATRDGEVVGSNFLDERSPIVGVGPISVKPAAQNGGIGRLLMEHVLCRAKQRRSSGVRLVQAAYHNRSLCLYSKIGFRAREPLSLMSGVPPRMSLAGYSVRKATPRDLEGCNKLCCTVHGHDRAGELEEAVQRETAFVVERHGTITGYTTGIGFFGHSVGKTNADIMALIAAAEAISGPGLLVPTRNHELFGWCLESGLKVVFQMTLMSVGLYAEPTGAYLPSVLY